MVPSNDTRLPKVKGESMRARDIMDTRFHVFHPRNEIAAAVKKFKSASLEEGQKVFGRMVVENEIMGIFLFLAGKDVTIHRLDS
jgi:hypothetical protein